MKHHKQVLLLVIDALTPRVFGPALASGKLPHFAALAKAGYLDLAATAIFPSITQAALSSIATGVYPQIHGIPGGYWFDRERTAVVHYMGDAWIALRQGVREFFGDLIYRLNAEQLQGPTIFQRVERAGLKAASIHHLIYKGDIPHKVDASWMAKLMDRLLPGSQTISEAYGPSMLYFGDLIATSIESVDQSLPTVAGLSPYLGMEDAYAFDRLLTLAKARALPDFTLAYFLENDDQSHQVGPQKALPVLERLDQSLGELFESYGGLGPLLEQFCVLVTGDHSQADIVEDEAEASIQVEDLLAAFKLPAPGNPWSDEEELLVCPNMRALQIYFKQPDAALLELVAARLLEDPRVDQVMWRAAQTASGKAGYVVATQERGRLHAWPVVAGAPAGDHDGEAVDAWGCRWRWKGDLAAVEVAVNEDGRLNYGDYPNALERIAGALEAPVAGQLWATAKPGWEFSLGRTSVHAGGGSHGSLHKSDSLVPLLAAGLPAGIMPPQPFRSVDVTPLVLALLGVDDGPQLGTSRVLAPR